MSASALATTAHSPRRPGRKIMGLLLVLLWPICGLGQDPPPFSPPVSGFDDWGHFSHRDGAALYRAICQGCHMADAKGAIGAGHYPALAANPKLASAAYPTLTLLQGRHGMPSFAGYLDDEQIAAVINFVRSHFDNHYSDTLSAADIKKLR
jgi:Cytochrome C oxidase, cbb3-type, subunit III